MSRVVITGMGLLTPLGTDPGALTSRGGSLRRVEGLLPDGAVTAGTIDHIPVKELVRSPHLRRMDRIGRMAAVATALALRDAGLGNGGGAARERMAVGWATEFASLEATWQFQERVRTRGPRLANPMVFPNLVQNAVAGYMSILFDLQGPSMTFCHHETAGFEALSWAVRSLRKDRADAVVVGVSEELGELLYRARSFFGIPTPPGEGAAALVLERLDVAERRGARVRATVGAQSVASQPGAPYRYPDDAFCAEVLERAVAADDLAVGDLERVFGLGEDLSGRVGASAVLPVLHLAALAHRGTLPGAVVARARGGATRAVVLAPPPAVG